jgi:hypothetical protein
VVLQGRCITHQALAAIGGSERISMVTAFRPRSCFVKDTSVLTTIRPLSNLSEVYFQWTTYRIEVLQERLRIIQGMMQEEYEKGKETDVDRIKSFLKEQEDWLGGTHREIEP